MKLFSIIFHASIITGFIFCGDKPNSPIQYPLQPSIVNITTVSDSTITLLWSASNATDFACYNLFCSTDSSSLFTSLVDSTILRTDTIHTIQGLNPNTHYYFGVVTLNSSLQSARSNIVDTTTDTIHPPQPSIIRITAASDSTITLLWSSSNATDFVCYKLFCSPDSSSLFTSLVDSTIVQTDTIHTIRGLKPQTYYYLSEVTYFKTFLPVQSSIVAISTKSKIEFQFNPVPDTLHPVISIVGLTGGLCKTTNSTLVGTVALYRSFVQDEQGRRISDTNIISINIGGFSTYFPLPFIIESQDSIFARIARLKTEQYKASPFTPWDSVITTNSDFSMLAIVYNRVLIIANGALTIPAGANLTGCVVLSNKSIMVSGSTTTCLIEADSGIGIEAGMHGSQFFSHGLITIGSSAEFVASNAIISHRPFNTGTKKYSGGITIDSQSTVRGTIISCGDFYGSGTNTTDIAISIGGKSRIEGIVVTDRTLWIKNCTVIGHVWCNRIENVDRNVGYINYLWGMTVLEPYPEYQVPLLGAPFVLAVDLFP